MTYRQRAYGGLLLILAVVVVIGYAAHIPGVALAPLMVLLVINLLLVEVGRYFIVGKPTNAHKAWTYRQKHYAEAGFIIVVNTAAIYLLPFPSIVYIAFPIICIVNLLAIEIKYIFIKET